MEKLQKMVGPSASTIGPIQADEISEHDLRKPRATLSSTLRGLLDELQMSEAELADLTQLPQSTVNRLLAGHTADPRASTLAPIARLFDISIEELLGLEAPINRIKGSYRSEVAKSRAIPIIGWREVASWPALQQTLNSHNHMQWLIADQRVSPACFAVKARHQHEPFFCRGSILIIDPSVAPTDGATIVVTLQSNSNTLSGAPPSYAEAGIRKLQHHGGSLYINGLKASQLTPEKIDPTRIVGTIIEVRMHIDDANVDC